MDVVFDDFLYDDLYALVLLLITMVHDNIVALHELLVGADLEVRILVSRHNLAEALNLQQRLCGTFNACLILKGLFL